MRAAILIVIAGVLMTCDMKGQCMIGASCEFGLIDFRFLKRYALKSDATKKKNEYSYVFTKMTRYRINLCSEPSSARQDIKVTIANSHRQTMFATTLNVASLNEIYFDCHATGIYYLTFEFQEPAFCGETILGFVKAASP